MGPSAPPTPWFAVGMCTFAVTAGLAADLGDTTALLFPSQTASGTASA